MPKVQVKLGSSSSRGFYSPDIEKEYTEIQEGKMPHTVLGILQRNIVTIELGITELGLSDSLLKVRPDLAVDEYGYSSTLPSLLKDFTKSKLVTLERGKYKITKLGVEFYKNNVQEAV